MHYQNWTIWCGFTLVASSHLFNIFSLHLSCVFIELWLWLYPSHIFFQRFLDEACHPSPCGVNTQCRVENEQPVCTCLASFKGNPITGCNHECESDHDCGSSQYCKNFKCYSACEQCGKGALCNGVINHRPQCECPKTYIGSPFTECRPECYGDVDCPSSKPACIYGICKNPCDGACGINANCNLRGLTPICSCPRDQTGKLFDLKFIYIHKYNNFQLNN